MPSNFIGPPVREFNQLAMLADNELINLAVKDVDSCLLVAMCVNASQGNGYFCCGMRQYREAMDDIMRRTLIDHKGFLNRITPTTGFRKGQIPKFAYNPAHTGDVRVYQMFSEIDYIDEICYACDWGLAQIPGWMVAKKVKPDFRRQFLQNYLADPNMQMRVLIGLFAPILRKAGHDETEALREWHCQCHRGERTKTKADRDVALAVELRELADIASTRYTV